MNQKKHQSILLVLGFIGLMILTDCGKIGGRLGAKVSREMSESLSRKSRKIAGSIDAPKLKYEDLSDNVKLALLK